jgi:oligoendopeptidase F
VTGTSIKNGGFDIYLKIGGGILYNLLMPDYPTVWNLTPLFKDDADPAIAETNAAFAAGSRKFAQKWRNRSDYLTDPRVLRRALDEYSGLFSRLGSQPLSWYYFYLRLAQDQNNTAAKAGYNQASELARKTETDRQFFELNLAKIPPARQREFLAAGDLTAYRHFLEKIFRQAIHNLSEPEERILSLKNQTSYLNWAHLTDGLLTKQKTPDGKSFTQIAPLCTSPDKKVRTAAGRAVGTILAGLADVAEAELNSILEERKTEDELRQYSRPEAARHLADDMDTEVVEALISTVAAHFDLSQKIYSLLVKLHGVARLEYFEKDLPYGRVTEKFTFPEAADLVRKTFTRLDGEFGTVFEDFLRHGRIDAVPKAGKRAGAFCIHVDQAAAPVYVLLNFAGRLDDVNTIAHEMGHAIHSTLSKTHQNALNSDYPTSVAEVASTFFEGFVFDELLRRVTEEERLSLQVARLLTDARTVFRQTAFYRFEQDLHAAFRQKGYIAKEEIGAGFQKYMAAYLGPKIGTDSANWWVHVWHFRVFFYVYSYVSGQLISKALRAKVKADPEQVVKVKEFLSAGSAESPRDIFRKLGIDIADKSFWEAGIAEIARELEETTALAKKLGKL